MKRIKIGPLFIILFAFTLSCTSQKKVDRDEEFATETVAADTPEAELNMDEASDVTPVAKQDSPVVDEFAEFEDSSSAKGNTVKNSSEDDLEKELNQLNATENKTAEVTPPPEAEIPAPDTPVEVTQTPPPEVPPVDVTQVPPPEVPPVDVTQAPPPEAAPVEVTQAPPPEAKIPQVELSQINSVQYQGNKSGGTIVINSTAPLQFTTRMNSTTNQLVVEVQNSIIPKKLKRSLNTKDMASSIGSVDIYQKSNSKVSRFVIQLRPGASEPLVQPEGNSLLIVGAAFGNQESPANQARKGKQDSNGNQSGNTDSSPEQNTAATQTQDVNPDLTSEGIMNSQSLEDFLASNNKYYGKKISIEANKLDINEAFKFLAEESNVNMIIDQGVTGEVSLKLRQVPWDQAFVLILKSKKLGYKRQGNVIRIALIETLIKEEDDSIKLLEARRSSEPLTVKRFFIGYADLTDLEKKIKDFISTTTITASGQTSATASRGKVISDLRTSSLIVTESATNIAKIEKLIMALDSQPRQVLIEAKVVEAAEKFVRGLGINWSSPAAGGFDSAPSGNLIRPTLNFASGLGNSIFSPSFGLGAAGRPGDLGNLTASLTLGEREDKLRVLSSPRISVLSNQAAIISQTVNIIVDKSTTTQTSGATTTLTEPVAVGVSLKVTPQVSNEGTVVMDLDIERSFPGSARTSEIEKRNAKTKVIVRSGQTAVIGGIFQADASESVSGIPFLKDIPIFGLLFKGQQTAKNKNELVIFITPRIQKPVQGETAAPATIE